MDVQAFLVALVSAVIVFGSFFLARFWCSGWKAAAVRIAGVLVGLMMIPIGHSVLSSPVSAAAKSGEYWFYMAILGVLLLVVLRKKKPATVDGQ